MENVNVDIVHLQKGRREREQGKMSSLISCIYEKEEGAHLATDSVQGSSDRFLRKLFFALDLSFPPRIKRPIKNIGLVFLIREGSSKVTLFFPRACQ